MTSQEVLEELHTHIDPVRAEQAARYFKTGAGQYGEGDLFIGITVPNVRLVARIHKDLPPAEVFELMCRPEHEARLCALIILVNRFRRTKSDTEKSELFAVYLEVVRNGRVNNWDLVDTSAPTFGQYLLSNPDRRELLTELALSDSLWERRVSVMFTFAFIDEGIFEDSLFLAELLLQDTQDLIHKATGWMLREIGKKDIEVLRGFLTNHVFALPRTELRYAIEKMEPDERKYWLSVRK